MRGLVPRIQAKKKHWIAGTSLDKPGDDEGEVVRYDRNALSFGDLLGKSGISLPRVISISFFLIADIASLRGAIIRIAPQNLVAVAKSMGRTVAGSMNLDARTGGITPATGRSSVVVLIGDGAGRILEAMEK